MDDIRAERLQRELIAAAVAHRAAELGGAIPWHELSDFELPDGTHQRLVDPGRGGIWNPRDMQATLSILTSPDGPYSDREDQGFLHYSYQRGPEGGKNLKLRAALDLGLPVIRFHKINKAVYQPVFPIFVIGDNPITREFILSLDDKMRAIPDLDDLSPVERAYAQRLVKQRLHQPGFRARVILAYERRCCICSLGHAELLDAAHILADAEGGGDPVLPNGLSLCKIHHAAYDRDFLGIDPSGTIHINQRLLDEIDGPMLQHGLQAMHGRRISQPSRKTARPDPERLDERFRRFQSSA